MFRIGRVSTLLISFLCLATANELNPYLAHFGISEHSFGYGHIFDAIYTLRIDYNIVGHQLDLPNDLDCTKYSNVGNRKRRSLERKPYNDSLLLNSELCEYEVNLESTIADSVIEEQFWQTLMKEKHFSNIYCDDGYSDNCILRKLHMPNATFIWRKRFDYRENAFTIVPTVEIYRKPRNIPVVKEVMYRIESMIESAQKGKMIEISYHCLGDPFNAMPLDPLILKTQAERTAIIATHLGKDKIILKNEPYKIIRASKLIVQNITFFEQEAPSDLFGENYLKFLNITREIKREINNLKELEGQLMTAVQTVDVNTNTATDKRPTNKICRNWFYVRERIDNYYKMYFEYLNITRPNQTYINYTADFAFVCANAAFLRLKHNAIESVNRYELDKIQKEVLTLLNIQFELNKDDRYNVNSRIEKFKNIPVYESVKMDILEAEKRKIRAEIELKNLNAKIYEYDLLIQGKNRIITEYKDQLQTLENNLTSFLVLKNSNLNKLNQTIQERKELEQQFLNATTDLHKPFRKIVYLPKTKDFWFNTNRMDLKYGTFNLTDEEKLDHLNATIRSHKLKEKIDEIEELVNSLNTTNRLYNAIITELMKEKPQLENELDSHKKEKSKIINKVDELTENVEKERTTIEEVHTLWESRYNLLDREKRDLEVEKNLEIQAYKDKASVDENWKDDLFTKINQLSTRIRNTNETIFSHLRQKREISQEFKNNIYNHCVAVNGQIKQIKDELKDEYEQLSQAGTRKKRKAGVLDTIYKFALAGGVALNFWRDDDEDTQTKKQDQILNIKIDKAYGEFVSALKLTSSMQTNMQSAITHMSQNLNAINSHLNGSNTEKDAILKEIDK